MDSLLPRLTIWSGTNAVTRRKQSWARLMSSPRASALPPVISRAGRPAPSRCSESLDSPSSRDDQPRKVSPHIRTVARDPLEGRPFARATFLTLAQPEVRTPDPARLADTGDLCEPQEWPRGASTDGQRRHRGGIARCRYLFFRRAGPRTRRASHDRRRLVRARHWTARPARRDRHDAYA